MLYPTPPGTACPVRAIEAPTDIEDSDIRLVLVDGSTVELSEEDYAL
jgi:hypothetical protein